MPHRPRMPFPRQVSGMLADSLGSLGLADRFREAEIWRIWPDVVGGVVAERARPLRIINGTLTVAVSSAPWMQELRFMTPLIREKLNSRLGAEVVGGIVLKAGSVAPAVREPADPGIPPHDPTPEQRTLIESRAADISDPETRQAFMELMLAALARG